MTCKTPKDDGRDLSRELAAEGWRTPDTWDDYFLASLPKSSGIYLLVVVDFGCDPYSRKVAYVGKSLNVSRRLCAHSMINFIKNGPGDVHVQRWVKELPADEITQAEIDQIKRFDPPLNIIHRPRDANRYLGSLQERPV